MIGSARRHAWALVHAERAALVDDLRLLDEDQWDRPSLCAGWTVHDVVAHLVHGAQLGQWQAVVGFARAGWDLNRQNSAGVERYRGTTALETLQRLAEVASKEVAPLAPLDSRLVEVVVHGEDIRRPLGLSHRYADEAVVRALRLQARTSRARGGARELLSSVRVTATDADVSLGDGPEVRGPMVSLLLALCGRKAAHADLMNATAFG